MNLLLLVLEVYFDAIIYQYKYVCSFSYFYKQIQAKEDSLQHKRQKNSN